MNSPGLAAVSASLGGAALVLESTSRRARLRSERLSMLGEIPTEGRRDRSTPPRIAALRRFVARGAAVVLGVWAGWWMGGPFLAVIGGSVAAAGVRMANARRRVPDVRALDRQVGRLAEGIASAVRGGLSISQAVDFACSEAEPPMTPFVQEFLHDREGGVPFHAALDRLSSNVGTDEIRLLAMVLGIHHRSGGNVAGALDGVAATIRHRQRLRRELYALTAQGRISGVVLGALPIGFFFVMTLTSRGQVAPVLASPVGMLMVTVGFVLEGLAFVWIRRLLRVEP